MWSGLAVSVTACHGLLDVTNPTLVRETDIANAPGANAKRLNVVSYMLQALPIVVFNGAMLTDEWILDGPPSEPPNPLNARDSQGYETSQGGADRHLGGLDRVFYESSIAIVAVRAYTPDPLRSEFLGELYGLSGFAVLQAAEDLCPGFPLNDVSAESQPIFGHPLTTDSALALANALLDSAVKYAHDSTRFVTLARVAKGRALLDQGKFDEAAAVVHPIETSATFDATYPNYNNVSSPMRGVWGNGGFNFALGDLEGGNGLPYVSENDARIPLIVGGKSAVDTTITKYKTSKYPRVSSITMASGIEARLIEAEAAVHAGDPNWITILNDLRANAISPALPALDAPTAVDSQVNLVYRERAYWLFLTGRRLGDMRRLIRVYGRNSETVFPTGPYPSGGTYGTATAIPFTFESAKTSNPYVTSGCTSR